MFESAEEEESLMKKDLMLEVPDKKTSCLDLKIIFDD